MTLLDKQQELILRYEILPGPQERLNALVDKAGKVAPLPEAEKTEANRVIGCQSRVHIIGSLENGHSHFRCDADSVLVKGLVVLICGLYDGATPEEIIQVEPKIFEQLGIWQILSPTRQNGLTHVRRFIKEWAEEKVRNT